MSRWVHRALCHQTCTSFSFSYCIHSSSQSCSLCQVTLSFHTPESGSRRLFVFSYNHSWRAWQRHTDFGCVLDVASSTVTTKLAHFSLYGVMLEEMGFKANLPAPPPPPSFQTPPPRRTVQPLFYAFGGLVLMALMCVGGLRQVSRFRERRRLRVVACELAEKERKESAGEEQEEGSDQVLGGTRLK